MNTKTRFKIGGLLLGVLALIALCIPQVRGGVKTVLTPYTVVTLTNVPSVISGAYGSTGASNNTEFVDVSRHTDVYVQIGAALMYTNPAAATLSVPVYRSIDGVTAETTAFTTLVLTFGGTVPKVWGTNINTGGAAYLLVGGYTSSATNYVTNLTVRVAGKQPWALTWPYSSYP